MAMTPSQADVLRSCGIFVPADNSDPAGNGDGTQGGLITVQGICISTSLAGWRGELVAAISKKVVSSTPAQPAVTHDQMIYSVLKR